MIPFDNVSSVSKTPVSKSSSYTRYRNGDGRFAGTMLTPPGGVVSDIGTKEVSKSQTPRTPKPMVAKPMQPLKPPTPPGMPRPHTRAGTLPRPQQVPSTKLKTPAKPRIKQTGVGISKSKKKDYSGAAIGSGSVIGATGYLGGGIPGTKPGNPNKPRATWTPKTHVKTAAKSGIFGYRTDAHQGYLNQAQSDLKGWKPTTRLNHFERGVRQGKVAQEQKIIRHLKRGRAGSNVALVGGAAMVGAGLNQRRKQGKVSKAKSETPRADKVLAAGATTAALGGGGSMALDHQGRKWARNSAANLDAAQKLNRKMGGYDVNYRPGHPTVSALRHKVSRIPQTPKMFRGVPDVKPHKDTGNIMWNQKENFAGRSNKATVEAGKHRGKATQARYFARVYGQNARYARKAGKAGVVIAATGAGGKYLQPRSSDKVSKNLVLKPRPRGHAERQATAQRAARTRQQRDQQVAKSKRGELLARQFERERQMRSWSRKANRVFSVSKGSPDQSEVHVMGGLGNQRNTRVRRPKYKESTRRVR